MLLDPKLFLVTILLTFVSSNELIESVIKSKEEICSTWIFAAAEDETDEMGEITATGISTSPKTKDFYFPVLNTNSKGRSQWGNQSFFDLEFSEEELKFPSKFVIKFSRACNLVIIRGDTEEKITEVTMNLLFQRLSRPHKDYFIFPENPTLMESEFANNFRHKFTLQSDTRQLNSFCEQNMFSRICRNTVKGRHLRVTAVFGPQMFRYKNHPNGSLISGGGTYFQMLQESSERLNFSFSIRKASNNGASGLKDSTGRWTGGLGDILYWDADLSVNAALSYSRFSIIDPSATVNWIHRIFYIRKPPLQTQWNAVFRPLNSILWLLTGLISIIVVTIYHLSVLAKLRKDKVEYEHKNGLLMETITELFSMLVEQCTPVSKKKGVGSRVRFIIFMWCSFALVLGTGYRSKLVSFLAFLQSAPVPTTHQELVESNYTMFFRYYGGIAYDYMMKSDSVVHKKILHKAVLINTSYDCIILAGMTENSACLDYDFNSDYAVMTNGSLQGGDIFVRSNDPDIPLLMVYCYRKGSPLTETLDDYLLRYLSSGLFRFWLETDWRKGKSEGIAWLEQQKESPLRMRIQDILEDLLPGPKALNQSSLLGVFLLSLIGIGAATIVFILEIVVSRVNRIQILWDCLSQYDFTCIAESAPEISEGDGTVSELSTHHIITVIPSVVKI